MSRKRTYRKPRTGPSWFEVIAAHQPFPQADADVIMLRINDAFGQVAAGSTDEDLFDRLAAMANVGLIRCEEIGREGEEVFRAAQQALMEADGLRGRHGRPGFTGPGLEAMRAAIAVYDEILRASSPAQMTAALQECMRRIRAGHVERAPA